MGFKSDDFWIMYYVSLRGLHKIRRAGRLTDGVNEMKWTRLLKYTQSLRTCFCLQKCAPLPWRSYGVKVNCEIRANFFSFFYLLHSTQERFSVCPPLRWYKIVNKSTDIEMCRDPLESVLLKMERGEMGSGGIACCLWSLRTIRV